MKQSPKVTPDDVRALTKPTDSFLCSVHANVYDIYFFQFKIRDVDSGKEVLQL